MAAVPKVALGSQGLQVSAQGLGCMGMSAFYGPPGPEEEMIQLIHEAVERGISFLDTADFYGPHTNEILIGKAIKGIRHKVQLATKFGGFLEGNVPIVRGDPEYVRSACEASLKRLEVDCIDLFYQIRIDPKVPIEITMGEMRKLVQEGKIKYVGLSEASASDIRRAHAVQPISAIQLEYSLWSRDVEEQIIPLCRELGIGIVAYSPLGRGFFSGKNLADFAENDFRLQHPRFQAFQENKRFYDRLCELGAQKKCTPGQLALAWVQHKGVVPIPGTTKLKNLEENSGSMCIKLSAEEVQALEAAVPQEQVQGGRYGERDIGHTWQFINSLPLESWTGVREA